MTDALGQIIQMDDYVAFPSLVGRKAVMRYGRVDHFGKTTRTDRVVHDTIVCETAYSDWETGEFGLMDRKHSVGPMRCVKLSYIPASLKGVLHG